MDKANYIGISQSYYNMYLNGKKKMTLKLAYRLSHLFVEKGLEWFLKSSPDNVDVFLDNNIPER